MSTHIAPSRKALRLALIYALSAAIWIALSDILANFLTEIPNSYLQISLYKGWLFVLVTTIWLYFLLRQEFARLHKSTTAAENNKNLLENVLETVPLGICLLDAEGKIYRANPEAIKIWGGTSNVGNENFDIYKGWGLPGDELIATKDWGGARAILEGVSTINEELRIERLDGEIRYILHSAIPLRDSQGGISGAVVVNQDLTDQKLAETSFKTTENLLSKLLENAPTPIFVTCAEGRIRLVNHAWAKTARMNPQQVVGLKVHQVFPDEVAQQYLENNRLVLEGQTVLNTEENLEFEDGWHSYKVVKFPVFDAVEKKMAVGGIAIDITEQKQMEEDLQRYHKNLIALASDITLAEERERRNIAIGLHDEIAQPLALAKIRLGQMIADEQGDNLIHVANVVRELIDVTIQKVRTLTFELSPPILYELGLDAALRSLAERFSAQKDFVIDFENDCDVNLFDENLSILLYQAARELLVNIVKHAAATRIKIEMRVDGQTFSLIVEDNGVGFDPQHSNSKGIGLFSIRERIKNYGGKLDIQPAPDHGVRCIVSVPIPEAELTEGASHEHSNHSGG